MPSQVIDSILDGDNSIRAWREHRGLTQQALADSASVSKPYLSQIEAGKRTGTAEVLTRIAETLDLSLDDMVVIEPKFL